MQPKELSKRDTMFLHIIPTLLVFLAFLGVSVWSGISAYQDVNDEEYRINKQVVESTEQGIRDRVAIYEEVLQAGTGLFNASDFVSRDEWQKFTSTFDLQQHYPGLQGLAYAPIIAKADLAAHEAAARNDGISDYKVWPATDRSAYIPVTYIEPMDSRNKRVLGYDMLNNPNRQEAMEQARDTNQAIISKRIKLLQDVDQPNEPGLLMYLPIYRNDMPIATVEQRRAAVSGYVYAPFRARDFFGSIFSNVQAANPGVQFRVYEGRDENPEKLLFESPDYKKVTDPLNGGSSSKVLVNNRELTIDYLIPSDSISGSVRSRPVNTIVGGLLFSALLAGLVLALLVSRTRALAYAEAREVQQAKDDLLSLASHQLRTPATGVKQYIGMLKQGYAGKLTPTQKELIEHAYNSNERQLGIIDEILHVARIDTGRIVLNFTKVNISKLIDEIFAEHKDTFKNRSQKSKILKPKRAVIIEADQQYLRMVIENLLSNASKYTDKGGKITLALLQTAHDITIEVRDTGVGIAKNEHHMLFKKFSRIHNRMTAKTEGSGIGLYIAEQIISLHGGNVHVESEPDKGSIFRITLPKKQPGNIKSV